ncbi:MAG: DUF7146 domain-containing protein [Shimia sp.]
MQMLPISMPVPGPIISKHWGVFFAPAIRTAFEADMNARDIIERLGGDTRAGLAPCPVCQPEGRRDQRALSVRDGDDRLLLHCHKSGCGFRDILGALGLSGGDCRAPDLAQINRQRAERERKEAGKLERARATWRRSNAINGTPGETYLRGRGIMCRLPATIRWADAEYHWPTGAHLPAMIAKVEPTGAIHRTFFGTDGKRLAKENKLMLGSTRGGAVRLSDGAGPLVVAEGIESALSLMCGALDGPAQVWAALSTSGMKSLDLPPNPGDIIVAVDGDPAGRAAGFDLMARAAGQGWRVSHMTPPDGLDWNDVLVGKGGAA